MHRASEGPKEMANEEEWKKKTNRKKTIQKHGADTFNKRQLHTKTARTNERMMRNTKNNLYLYIKMYVCVYILHACNRQKCTKKLRKLLFHVAFT